MSIYNSDDYDYWGDMKPTKPRIVPAEGDTMIRCIVCKGKGKISMYNEETRKPEKVTCPYCNGTGHTIKELTV